MAMQEREFRSRGELLDHYRAVRARLNAGPPPPPPPPPRERPEADRVFNLKASFKLLLSIVADEQDVEPDEILYGGREAEVSRARAILCWVVDGTLIHRSRAAAIGRLVGIDRSSVVYAIKRVERERAGDAETAASTDAMVERARREAAQDGLRLLPPSPLPVTGNL